MEEKGGFSAGGILLAFLIGGAIGAAATIMFTPESGEDVRRRIREFTGEAKERANGFAENAKSSMSSTMEKGKKLYEEKKSAISDAIGAGKEAYQKEVGEISKSD